MTDIATRALGWPFRIGAALRHARVFHPNGFLASGRIERIADPAFGVPIESGPVRVRLSKGIGTPGGLPDVGGIAIRLSQPERWDILLATSGTNPIARCAVLPSVSWARARFSTLMPLAYQGRSWRLQAELASSSRDFSLASLEAEIAERPLVVHLRQAAGAEGFADLAKVRLDTVISTDDDEAPPFDPILNTHDDVRLQPEWLRIVREAAYDNSRRGRRGT
ncbi:phosphodiesterase [Aldersonia sp. NBC_00410]|uniref:phosphodiesterase n=1 Tax=Aldersonia sp. NBC_00410 TaxID=2975954 RepID=UPI00225BDFEB|nr:phosphodiesterase [Aldersonia sp. NBC_00410]MCX5043061.1 phosphodiesterase [Aldersonia sp. NBC_00410]